MNQISQINTIIEETFDTFDARGYLNEYYSTIDIENDNLLRFYVDCYKNIKSSATLLEFGGGPTIYALIAAAIKVKEIHFCDCVKGNLEQIELWKNVDRKAFNWNLYIQRVLEKEGLKNVTKKDIQERATVLRSKLTKLLYCDAFQEKPLGNDYNKRYDIVQSNFVAESITSSKNEWRKILEHITSLVKPDGTLIMTAIENSSYYYLEKRRFPAVSVTEAMILKELTKLGFNSHEIVREIPANPPYRGYDGFIFIKAKRSH